MSNERDQVQLQRHIKEAEDRATAGGHQLGPWQPASRSGLYQVEATCLRCGEKVANWELRRPLHSRGGWRWGWCTEYHADLDTPFSSLSGRRRDFYGSLRNPVVKFAKPFFLPMRKRI